MSRKVSFPDLSEKVQDTPQLFIVDWNRAQYFWSVMGSGWCFQTTNPSSMYLFMKGRNARSSGVKLSFSNIPRDKFAIAVAGPVPMEKT